MGITIGIYEDAKKWKVVNDKEVVVVPCNEPLIKVRIGEADYDWQGTWDIEIYMRKYIYDKLIAGEYTAHNNGGELLIKDEKGNEVPAFSREGRTIY